VSFFSDFPLLYSFGLSLMATVFTPLFAHVAVRRRSTALVYVAAILNLVLCILFGAFIVAAMRFAPRGVPKFLLGSILTVRSRPPPRTTAAHHTT